FAARWTAACAGMVGSVGPAARVGTAFSMGLAATVAIVTNLGLATVARAQAGQFEQYQQAQEAFREQRYQDAVNLLEPLVGGEIARVEDRALRQVSRKLLGASYLYVQRQRDAEAQFAAVLEEDLLQSMEGFSSEVSRVFDTVRVRVEREQAAEEARRRREEEERRRREAEELLREERRWQQLVEIAETEVVESQNQLFVAFIPFGFGQFQNGDTGLGYAFLISGAVLALTSLGTFIAFTIVDNDRAEAESDPLGTELDPSIFTTIDALRITNVISFFGAVAIGITSIVEALVSYEPVTVGERSNPNRVPEELRQRNPNPEPELQLAVGLGSASLHLSF
ncbi:MAG: hypothetical protein AAGF12_37535, partial [Myxococcota bacterium]